MLATCMIAIASFIRGIESASPLPAKFSISLGFLILSSLLITFYKLRPGSTFKSPLYEGDRFSWQIFMILVIGGISELIGSIAVLESLKAAQEGNINQGMVASINMLNLVIVTVLSYFFFNERVSLIQLIGILIVIAAIITLSCTGPESPPSISQSTTSKASGMVSVTIWAVVSSLSISACIMCNKWLAIHKNISGDISSPYILLIEGTIGTVCLVITTLSGSGLHELSSGSFWFLMLATFFLYTAIIMANYTISIGIAGVVLSILNSNAALHVVLSAIFLG